MAWRSRWVAGLGGAGVAGFRGRGSRRGQVFVAVVVGGGSRRGPCRSSWTGLRGQVFVAVVVVVAVVLW